MKTIKIAFDVDNTLIWINSRGETVPKYTLVFTLQMLHGLADNVDLIVWSGSGIDYAKRWTEKLGIDNLVRVIEKGSEEVDIAFDDQPDTDLAKSNIILAP